MYIIFIKLKLALKLECYSIHVNLHQLKNERYSIRVRERVKTRQRLRLIGSIIDKTYVNQLFMRQFLLLFTWGLFFSDGPLLSTRFIFVFHHWPIHLSIFLSKQFIFLRDFLRTQKNVTKWPSLRIKIIKKGQFNVYF